MQCTPVLSDCCMLDCYMQLLLRIQLTQLKVDAQKTPTSRATQSTVILSP
jgi:hypothetical protein